MNRVISDIRLPSNYSERLEKITSPKATKARKSILLDVADTCHLLEDAIEGIFCTTLLTLATSASILV